MLREDPPDIYKGNPQLFWLSGQPYELAVPSLENIAQWIWRKLDNRVAGVDRVSVRRGVLGNGEGCTYRGRPSATQRAA